jgi:hypothetical protein
MPTAAHMRRAQKLCSVAGSVSTVHYLTIQSHAWFVSFACCAPTPAWFSSGCVEEFAHGHLLYDPHLHNGASSACGDCVTRPARASALPCSVSIQAAAAGTHLVIFTGRFRLLIRRNQAACCCITTGGCVVGAMQWTQVVAPWQATVDMFAHSHLAAVGGVPTNCSYVWSSSWLGHTEATWQPAVGAFAGIAASASESQCCLC